MADAAMKLIRFGAEWCPSCKALKKAGTVEKWATGKTNVVLVEALLPEDEPQTKEEKCADKLADDHGIKGIPAIVFTDAEGEELTSIHGAITQKSLEREYRKAMAELEFDSDEDEDEDDESEDEDGDDEDETDEK